MSSDFDISAIFNDILKYRDKYQKELIVIKFGGSLAENDEIIRSIGRQAAFLTHSINARVIVVHGGGRQINDALEKENIQPKRDPDTNLRMTDEPTVRISDQALRNLNGHIVRLFHEASKDIHVVGMAGYDGRTVRAKPLNYYTGEAAQISVDYLTHLMNFKDGGTIPVIYPICWNDQPHKDEARLNVNADSVAAAIASQMNARRLILCSDIPGVLDNNGNLLTGLSSHDVDHLIDKGIVTGGMVTKLRAASEAAESIPNGGVAILDGRKDNVILAELLFEKGAGTLIRGTERTRALQEQAHKHS